MANIEESILPEAPKRRLHLDWILPVVVRPAARLREIMHEEGSSWLTPLLLLSVLMVVAVLVAGPIRIQIAQSTPPTLPADFQYYSPEMQQQFYEANQPNVSPLMIYGFPILGGLAGIWLSWFLLSAILHVMLTLNGSRASRAADFSLAGWSMLPYAVRQIVQIGYMLVTHTMITRPGLSGFIPADATGVLAYAGAMLGLVDIYLVWQVVLLIIGATAGSGLKRGKVIGAVLLSVLILMLLQALPAFIGAQLGGLNVDSPVYFF